MKECMGMMLMILGMVTADSEWIIVPLTLMAAGLWLVKGVVEW